MKISFYSIILFFAVVFLNSCVTEESIKVDPSFELSFQRSGSANALAGSQFYVVVKGSGEYITLYDGTAGHVYGEAGATGLDFNKADSLPVLYKKAGKYKLSVLATSSSDFGHKDERQVKTVEITVLDKRNSFDEFYLIIDGQPVIGSMNDANEILFDLPDSRTDFHFKAAYVLASDSSLVSVNGVHQVSGTTENDFANPVVYIVKSVEGTEKSYTVKINRYAASNEKKLTSFQLGVGAFGETGVIDELNKTVTLIKNYSTATSYLSLESSFNSKLFVQSKLAIDNGPLYSDFRYTPDSLTAIKVVAENNSEEIYSVHTIAQDPITQFEFSNLIPSPKGVINTVDKTVTVTVLQGTDVTTLVPKWSGAMGKVLVGTALAQNGVTVTNFTNPVKYTFYKGTKKGDIYTVTVVVK
ncbi:MAG: hypothetical protein PHV20_03515 [Bacteroidales bacterium]|nr:hypothetical protein [Bacteroidales bacterium]